MSRLIVEWYLFWCASKTVSSPILCLRFGCSVYDNYSNDHFIFPLKPNIVNPTMEQAQKTQFVFLNRTSNLWCPVKGAPAPFIVWRKDGFAVQNTTSITFQVKITSENNVNYSCEVQSDGEIFRRNISLRVEGEVSLLRRTMSLLFITGSCKPPWSFIRSILITQKKFVFLIKVLIYNSFFNHACFLWVNYTVTRKCSSVTLVTAILPICLF